MRILQLITQRYRRGAEVFATLLSDALAQRGHEVQVVGLYEPPDDPLVPAVAPYHDLGARNRLKLNPILLWQLRAYIDAYQPDVVQANGSDTLKYGALARMLSRGSWPIVYRNISVASRWLPYPAYKVWGRFLTSNLTHVVSVAEEAREDFITTYGVPAARCSTIRRGIDLTPFPKEEARRTLSQIGDAPIEAPFLAHIGSYTPEKNHAFMIDAFAEIRRESPEAHLFLFGDGALRRDVESQIERLGLGRSVHVLGSRDDATSLVAGADIMLLPSRIEGIPGVILEAAAQAVPSVATDVGGVHEAIEHGERGLLVPLDDQQAFVDAVLRLINDPAGRLEMGEAARVFVCEHYSIARAAEAFEDLYRHVIANHSE